jgi:hypothetical protein
MTHPHRTEHPSCTLACYTCRRQGPRAVAHLGEAWESTERRAGEKGWLSLEVRHGRAWLCGECAQAVWKKVERMRVEP